MIRHFFLDKTNTIIENSKLNLGLNPILHISYGNGLMRGLIHFNIDDIKDLIKDKTFAEIENVKFYLTMTNCFSVAEGLVDDKLFYGVNKIGKRASSFDLMLFKLPCEFDAGRGYDYNNDFWLHSKSSFIEEGSSWFFAKTEVPWFNYNEGFIKENNTDGIYSKEYIKDEYEKYKNGEKSIIINTQHFDFGNENLYIDITKYVLEVLDTGINYGLCLSFTPFYEDICTDYSHCVNFFTDHTNTFFHPYIEVIYNNYIFDDRNNFDTLKNNNLYLYTFNENYPCNLDNIPNCTINGHNFNVKQVSKGVYCANINPKEINLKAENIYYDVWSNIVLNGEKINDIELEFYVNNKTNFYFGDKSSLKTNIIPSIYGINDGEELIQGEIRQINIDFIEKYTSKIVKPNKNSEYRLYVKDGDREIDVIKFHPIEINNDNNYFIIYTTDLIPQEYFIDIAMNNGRERKIFKNIVRFKITNNISDK